MDLSNGMRRRDTPTLTGQPDRVTFCYQSTQPVYNDYAAFQNNNPISLNNINPGIFEVFQSNYGQGTKKLNNNITMATVLFIYIYVFKNEFNCIKRCEIIFWSCLTFSEEQNLIFR